MPVTEPTDRSMLRVMTTSAWPMAIGRITAMLVEMRLNIRGLK